MNDSHDPAVLAAWAAVISSFVGPLIGVVIAHSLTQNASVRAEAGHLFRRVMEDTQRFLNAFIEVYATRLRFIGAGGHVNELLKTVEELQAAYPGQDGGMLKASDLFQSFTGSLSDAEQHHFNATKELQVVIAQLNVDVFWLGLMFGDKSKRCGALIRQMMVGATVFNQQELPPLEICRQKIGDLVQRACKEMEPLYEGLRERNPLPDA